jgi:hypothetical protein
VLLVDAGVKSGKLQPTPRHAMEDFLASVAQAMNDSGLTAVELIGCLEIAKAELMESLFNADEE